MKCPSCQFDNPESKKFCSKCGTPLTTFCPKCNCTVNPSDSFCGECGQPIGKKIETESLSATQPTATPKQETLSTQERKYVTVLFSDLSGYTAMTEKLDPEEVKDIMGRIFGEIAQIVARYEGFIEKFIGDAVMALFGVPHAHGNDPVRAIHAAIEIHDAVKKISPSLEEKIGRPLYMHTGINTGLVITGDVNIEKGTHGVLGDTINTASRLSGLAEADEILVGHYTYTQVDRYFDFTKMKPAKVKGKDDLVLVYKVLSAKKASSPRLMISSQMVGRDNELNKLKFAVMKGINGQGSIVNVIGEAGIGKSRLIEELKNLEDMKNVTLFEGRTLSTGRNLNFHLISSCLKNWAGITDDDSEMSAFNKLETSIRAVYPEGLSEVLPFVATLMGVRLIGQYAERVKGIEGEALEKLIMKNLRELLAVGSQRLPLVIIAEDVHWADTSSLELLETLFRLVEKQRIVFINLFRPGYTDTGDQLIAFIKERYPQYYTEIQIQPLDEKQGELLITNLLNIKGFPQKLRDQIIQRSGGNPYFIEEVIRSLIDEGAVLIKDKGFEITEKIHSITIPPTINEVLMARIDRLDQKTRELIRVASVIGRNFFYRILIEVATTIEEIDSRLKFLQETQLILEQKRLEELEYIFKHALAQEAAYSSILIQRRKELHRNVADAIEKVFSHRLHEFYGMLAYHYSLAENMEKLEEYLIKAGEEALKSTASAEALHYYRDALNLYIKKYGNNADPEKLAVLHSNIAIGLFNRGKLVEAVEAFDKALPFYGIEKPRNALSTKWRFVTSLLQYLIALYIPWLKWKKIPTEKDSQMLKLMVMRGTALVVTDSTRFAAEVLYADKKLVQFDIKGRINSISIVSKAGFGSYWLGIFWLGKKAHEFVSQRRDKNDAETRIAYYDTNVLRDLLTGGWKTREQYNPDIVKLGLAIGEKQLIVGYLLFHAVIDRETGNFIQTQNIIDELQKIYDLYEYDLARILYNVMKTELSMKLREFSDALRSAEEGLAVASKAGLNLYVLGLQSTKSRVYVMMNDLKNAENSLAIAEGHKDEARDVIYYTPSHPIGRFFCDLKTFEHTVQNKDKTAIGRMEKQVLKRGRDAIKDLHKVAFERVEVYKLMGVYYWLTGKQNKALVWWKKSIAEGESMGARLEVSRTYFEVGKRLSEPASKYKDLDDITAREYLEKARAMFEDMDLQWDLEELEKLRLQLAA